MNHLIRTLAWLLLLLISTEFVVSPDTELGSRTAIVGLTVAQTPAMGTNQTALDLPVIETNPKLDPELTELARWAIERFERAGLTVPATAIHLHRDREACGGHRGTFNPGLNRIDVCVMEPTVILHEIAHAWMNRHLSQAMRESYVAAGGFESWNAPATGWSDRGSEHAATTIAWGLMERPLALPSPDGPLAQANSAYRRLTGEDAPRIVAAAGPVEAIDHP